MAVGLGCSNMKRCIFDKWCWSAVTESCTLAEVDLIVILTYRIHNLFSICCCFCVLFVWGQITAVTDQTFTGFNASTGIHILLCDNNLLNFLSIFEEN